MNTEKLITKISQEIAEDIQDTYQDSICDLMYKLMQEKYSVPKNELDDLKHDDERMMSHNEAVRLILNELKKWIY